MSISIREVERRYNQMVAKSESVNSNIKEIRINCYRCESCKHITKTKDVDAGTTPMFLNCLNCKNRAVSTFYNDIAPEQNPSHEWFRPTLAQTIKWRTKNPAMLEHILLGGLELRPIAQNQTT